MAYIGQVSKLTGATIKAIRHYEALGLLPELERSGSYRIFTERHIIIIKLIKRAQTLGFKLTELKAIISSHSQNMAWQEIVILLREKEFQITQDITHLQNIHRQLHECVEEIETCLLNDPHCQTPLI